MSEEFDHKGGMSDLEKDPSGKGYLPIPMVEPDVDPRDLLMAAGLASTGDITMLLVTKEGYARTDIIEILRRVGRPSSVYSDPSALLDWLGRVYDELEKE